MNKQSGMTLMEMLISLAIIAIKLPVIAPADKPGNDRDRSLLLINVLSLSVCYSQQFSGKREVLVIINSSQPFPVLI